MTITGTAAAARRVGWHTINPLPVGEDHCAVWAAGHLLVGNGPALIADQRPLIDLRATPGGQLQLTVSVYSARGRTLAIICSNEWMAGELGRWQIQQAAGVLRMRYPQERVAVDVDATVNPMLLRAQLWHQGHHIDLRPATAYLNGSPMARRYLDGRVAAAGMALQVRPPSSQLELTPYQGGGRLIDWAAPASLAAAGRDAWRYLAGQGRPV